MSRITKAEIFDIVEVSLPVAASMGFKLDTLKPGHIRARVPYKSDYVRPGGTISGPAMMALADFTMYVVVMTLIGRVELAVTTNLNINFLRKLAQKDLIADGRILKLGKRLAVMEVTIFSKGEKVPVAHVTGTYSIPPSNQLVQTR
jgi:uncharacterized protein (TIGR00369 family)